MKGLTLRFSGRRAHEGQGRQRNATCFKATSAATFDATATMAGAKVPQRAENRLSTDGQGTAAQPTEQRRVNAVMRSQHA